MLPPRWMDYTSADLEDLVEVAHLGFPAETTAHRTTYKLWL